MKFFKGMPDWVVFMLVLAWLLFFMAIGVDLAGGQVGGECPRPTGLTAPSVGPWFRVVHGPTYQRIEVHFTLSDQYGDGESPLYLYEAADGVWRTTVDLGLVVTPCVDQYAQLIDFSLGVLNEGERPFTWGNQESVADYEAFLMGVHGYGLYLPLVGVGVRDG